MLVSVRYLVTVVRKEVARMITFSLLLREAWRSQKPGEEASDGLEVLAATAMARTKLREPVRHSPGTLAGSQWEGPPEESHPSGTASCRAEGVFYPS